MITSGSAPQGEPIATAIAAPPPKKMIIVMIAATTEMIGKASSDLSDFTTAQLCFDNFQPRLIRSMARKLLG